MRVFTDIDMGLKKDRITILAQSVANGMEFAIILSLGDFCKRFK